MKMFQISDKIDNVSRIGIGCMRITGLSDEKAVRSLIEGALECGINFFDHADIYGHYTCEKKFGEALALKPELRKKMQLVSKVGIKLVSENMPENTYHCYDTSYEHIVKSVEKSA